MTNEDGPRSQRRRHLELRIARFPRLRCWRRLCHRRCALQKHKLAVSHIKMRSATSGGRSASGSSTGRRESSEAGLSREGWRAAGISSAPMLRPAQGRAEHVVASSSSLVH